MTSRRQARLNKSVPYKYRHRSNGPSSASVKCACSSSCAAQFAAVELRIAIRLACGNDRQITECIGQQFVEFVDQSHLPRQKPCDRVSNVTTQIGSNHLIKPRALSDGPRLIDPKIDGDSSF